MNLVSFVSFGKLKMTKYLPLLTSKGELPLTILPCSCYLSSLAHSTTWLWFCFWPFGVGVWMWSLFLQILDSPNRVQIGACLLAFYTLVYPSSYPSEAKFQHSPLGWLVCILCVCRSVREYMEARGGCTIWIITHSNERERGRRGEKRRGEGKGRKGGEGRGVEKSLNRNKGSGEAMLLINYPGVWNKFLIRCLLPCQELYLSSQILLPPGAKIFYIVTTKYFDKLQKV